MRFYKFSILFLAILFLGCERDDICAEGTPTTPRLLVDFFDATDTDIPKTAVRLSVYAVNLVTDENTGVISFPEVANETTLVFNSNTDAIELPLIIGNEGEEITTRYFFETDTNLRIDGDTSTNSNIDILEIKYTHDFIYVSRACGFKSIFNMLTATDNPGDDSIDWIQNTVLANTTETSITVENEEATHVQIFH
ncbi:hypothetical protein BTO05_03565 [Winogradskyella sp. PC-19]|uniref:DUF6452 family protein n=1 Tax=unclassified Winogradskyella TaxID=2615021 RepID=UPI000B3D2481|nr:MULTISPECIES: DUF6452 family protein [unclassified Winogradskyella]ARV08758.1 hypothetical protein BTO05_03565 [Winogradskyella sp. PC-19]